MKGSDSVFMDSISFNCIHLLPIFLCVSPSYIKTKTKQDYQVNVKNAYIFLFVNVYTSKIHLLEMSHYKRKILFSYLPGFLFLKEEILERMRLNIKNQSKHSLRVLCNSLQTNLFEISFFSYTHITPLNNAIYNIEIQFPFPNSLQNI